MRRDCDIQYTGKQSATGDSTVVTCSAQASCSVVDAIYSTRVETLWLLTSIKLTKLQICKVQFGVHLLQIMKNAEVRKKQDKHLILYYILNTLPCTKHSSITFDEQHVTKALLAFSELQEASFESFFQLCENKLHEKTFIHTSMAIWKTLKTASFQQQWEHFMLTTMS